MAIKNLITSDPYYQNLVNPRGFPTGNDVYVPPTTPTPTPEEGIMNIINSNLAQKIYQYNNEGDADDDDNTIGDGSNFGINSFSDAFGAIKGNTNIGSVVGGFLGGPLGAILGGKAYGAFGGDGTTNTNNAVANMAQARGLTKSSALANPVTARDLAMGKDPGPGPGPGTTGGPVGGTTTGTTGATQDNQSGDGGSCFIAGTKVTMADGTFKNIEDIKVGDKVKGHKENNEVIKLDPTLLANRKLYSFNDNNHYFFTSEHPFMTEEGWKSVKPEKTKERDGIELYNQLEGELKIGDKLVTDKGLIEITDIKSKEINKPNMPLYNFNVSNDNSYIADNYVVHNKGGGGGTYVCTASYANNLITPLDFKTLKKYGIKLRRNDKYLMKAYDWFGPKLAAAVKKGKLVNFAKHSTSMWKYEQTKQDVSFKMKFMIRFNKIITRPIIRTVGVFLTIKEKLTK